MYKISLADSIVLAETKINNASIITADHHEFDIIEKPEPAGRRAKNLQVRQAPSNAPAKIPGQLRGFF
ncbi:hypothetical protein FACS1894151_05160 [Spirochaetia bacterium]|nr:hypothetical protein FACS1894151_05160 [Spirochaetia bacterium]